MFLRLKGEMEQGYKVVGKVGYKSRNADFEVYQATIYLP
jgi:hypothetical protein